MAKKDKPKVGERLLSPTQLKTKYNGTGIASQVMLGPSDGLWLPSKNLTLNYTLGGGIPYGRQVEIYGSESSGKTLMALDFGGVAQSLGGVIMFNDAEQAWDPAWAMANGIDLDQVELWNETSIERLSDWLGDMSLYYRSRLRGNEPIVFICDSIAALDCDANINSNQSDAAAEMGNRAKAMYRMLRTRNQLIAELGIICIWINQLRSKVGASKYEDSDETPGGKAMRFYASQRIGVYAGKQVKAKVNGTEQRVGSETSVRIKKNKVAPPRETFTTNMYFNPEYDKEPLGFDRYLGIADLLIKTGTLERSGAYYKFEGQSVAQGEASLITKIKSDPELRKKLITASGINTVSKTRAKIEATTKNLYPISGASKTVLDDDDEEEDDD